MRILFVPAFLLAALASCTTNPHLAARNPLPDCGQPSRTEYSAVHLQFAAPVNVDRELTARWVDGCAVVSFLIDGNGLIVDPVVMKRIPDDDALSAFAITMLERDRYAPGHRWQAGDTLPASHKRFAAGIGFSHKDGKFSIARNFSRGEPTVVR